VPPRTVTRTFLELPAPDALRPARRADARLTVTREAAPTVALARRLYRDVGGPWHWRDRDAWPDERYAAWLADPAVSLWVATEDAAIAGFFELVRHADASIELSLFGLLPGFAGRGLGGHLLTIAAETALAAHPTRFWLHTCSLDSPAALPNYLARGLVPTRTEQYEVDD
jgi:GNAT superfamily N-acetyltransferase